MDKQSVLVVDDEPDIRELLEITLMRMGLAVKCAEDYTSATRLLHSDTFDFCLTDMKLPDGDGQFHIAVCRDHGDGQMGVLLLDIAHQVDTVTIR